MYVSDDPRDLLEYNIKAWVNEEILEFPREESKKYKRKLDDI